MPLRTIPILPAGEARPPRLTGDPAQVRHVIDAIGTALHARIGWRLPVNVWLRELRLDDGEAFVAISTEMGGACGHSAEVAFDTLRRILPDTDIYVGAERS